MTTGAQPEGRPAGAAATAAEGPYQVAAQSSDPASLTHNKYK